MGWKMERKKEDEDRQVSKEMKAEDENGDGKGDRTQRWNV